MTLFLLPLLALAASAVAGDTVSSPQTDPTPTATPAAVAPKAERKICKRESVATSLHGSKRTCMTAAEWKARERNATLEDLGSVTTK